MRDSVFIAMPDGEHYTIAAYLHVTAVETIRNGNGEGKTRRKR